MIPLNIALEIIDQCIGAVEDIGHDSGDEFDRGVRASAEALRDLRDSVEIYYNLLVDKNAQAND